MKVSGNQSRVQASPASAAVVPVQESGSAEIRPKRRPWIHFIRRWALGVWLAITAAGIAAAAIPASFPGKVLLSSAIVGAGIAGLLAEFTFSVDRRDSDLELQADKQYQESLKRQIVGLEHQVGQVDILVQKTEIIAINQLFEFGIYLWMSRYGTEDHLEVFRNTIVDLGDILGIPNVVGRLLADPYLRPTEEPPKGKDPYNYLFPAIQLRYSTDGVEAFRAASAVGSLIIAPQHFADEGFRSRALSILRAAIPKLYLLPQVHDNVMKAIQGIDENASDINALHGYVLYFSLFSNYLEYRMSGRFADVAPFFEAPVSLTDPATVERLKQAVAKIAGVSPESSEHHVGEAAAQPAGAAAPVGPVPAGELARPPDADQVERKNWFSYLREWTLLFWFAVSAAGLVAAFISPNFAAKDLLTSAIFGAGIAGLISEFTICPDRRDADFELRSERQYESALEDQVASLEDQVGRVDVLLKNAEIITLNQLLFLGVDVYMTYFGTQNMGLADELAGILRLRNAVTKFLTSPHDLTTVNNDALTAYTDLMKAVETRYAEDGIEAYRSGAAVGNLVCYAGNALDPAEWEVPLSMLKKGIPQLYLLPTACDNVLGAIRDLENGSCEPGIFIAYLCAFVYYLSCRMNGAYNVVAALFESPMPLAKPTAKEEIGHALALITDAAAPEPADTQARATDVAAPSQPRSAS